MNKKLSILLTVLSVVSSGCATTPPPPAKAVDIEPIIVGKPVSQKVAESRNEITNQMDLLNKVQSGQKIGTYNVVKHNNDLDARIGSSKTVPQSYANKEKNEQAAKVAAANAKQKSEQEAKQESVKAKKVIKVNPYDVKVKKIVWNDDSLNQLAESFANSLHYQLVIKENNYKDIKINYTAENLTVRQAVDKFKKEVSNVADIIVVDENKTFNVIYK